METFLVFEAINKARYRSSHQKCSMKKGVLRNFTKFTGKHLCQSLFFNKVALLKKGLWHRCFLVNFVKALRTPFSQNTSGRLLLKITRNNCFYQGIETSRFGFKAINEAK